MQEKTTIRYPAVVGQFYKGEKNKLASEVEGYLNGVADINSGKDIKGIIVPHAGYYYSAQVAASAYKPLLGKKYKNVILIGNSHTQYFSGIAIDDSDLWETPLGDIEVNNELASAIAGFDNSIIKLDKEPHLEDHILEVQLPFLQIILEQGFKVVPIVFGNAEKSNYKVLVDALSKNLGDKDLLVISTDMSHYPAYEDANKIDNGTLVKIVECDADKLQAYIDETKNKNIAGEQTLLCGSDAVKTLMELAKISGWEGVVADYKNSGDVSVDKDRVVGYGAVIFSEIQRSKIKDKNDNLQLKIENILTDKQKNVLLQMAKETIEGFVNDGKIPEFDINDERLKRKQGAFVTLHQNGQLRGCIGQIEPSSQPLWEVVRDMAIEAATGDPRFYPVKKDDLKSLDYEISVLSAPEKIDDWKKIEMGKHGVIIRQGNMGGVFLPQVATETGWSREEFLSQLCSQKAGLDPECYLDDNTEIKIFTAEVFK